MSDIMSCNQYHHCGSTKFCSACLTKCSPHALLHSPIPTHSITHHQLLPPGWHPPKHQTCCLCILNFNEVSLQQHPWWVSISCIRIPELIWRLVQVAGCSAHCLSRHCPITGLDTINNLYMQTDHNFIATHTNTTTGMLVLAIVWSVLKAYIYMVYS